MTDPVAELGKALTGCGCLLTIFVTIPIVLLFLYLLI